MNARMAAALEDGYLVSFLAPGDRMVSLWQTIATVEGMPAVYVSPDPAGAIVSLMIDDDAADPVRAHVVHARMAAACETVPGAHVATHPTPPRIMAGPLPAPQAAALAGELARMDGTLFPLAAGLYARVIAAQRKEAPS